MKQMVVLLLLWQSIAGVRAVTITPGNGGGTVDHVRFTPDAVGANLGGWLNSNPSVLVDFHSSNTVKVDSGEASLAAIDGNGFHDLTFSLANGGTFTRAVVKPEASTGGTIDFNVSYAGQFPGTFSGSFLLNSQGQNFFTIDAGAGELITSITFNTADGAFGDSGQIRIGSVPSSAVPDGGATILLLGTVLAGLGLLRGRRCR
jgi:hypothetical protein